MKVNRIYGWPYIVLIFALFLSVLLPSGVAEAAENVVTLTEEEQNYIAEKQEIVIGCQANVSPLLYQDEKTGEIRGITVDVLNMVSDAIGLRFRYAALNSGAVTYEDIQELHVDVVASVEQHSVNEHAKGIAMTDAYLQTLKIFVCRKGVTFDPDSEMVIAVASGSPTLSQAIRDIYPKFQVVYYTSTEDALEALLEGKADAVLQNQYTLERVMAKPKYENLQVVAAAAMGDAHCLAAMVPLEQDEDTERDTALLIGILNKGIQSLDQGAVSFAVIKETTENEYRFTAEDTLYRYRYVAVVLLIGLIFILFLLWRIYILRKKRAEQLAEQQKARELAVVNRQMQEQQVLLEDALLRAESGNRAKSTFLFNMSHDIRTPMNAILGFAEVALQHAEDSNKIMDCLQKINDSGRYLLQLLNNTLDMSHLESGKVILSEDVCDLSEMVEKVRDVLQTEIEKKKLTIHMDLSGIRNRKVYCDDLRMNQILFNLINNAVNFSRQGGEVTLSVTQEEQDANGTAFYELHVKDNGIGMSPEFLQKIYDPFEREHNSTASGVQGTGLGLSITKGLVELMGGTINVASEPDKGTEFVIRFAFRVQEEAEEPENGEEITGTVDFAGKRLLLVEDNEINMMIAQELLSTSGFLVETAENGQIAVEKVRQSQPGYYDAVLMDIQMPVMDGYQATGEIRRLGIRELAEIPIIAVTANAFEEDRKEALASGMNDHVPKPLDMEALLDALRKVFARS